MAINPALLIAAPILQDYFVDNVTAQAMSAGIITCYQDNSRTTLKNWYYQTGVPGSYTYLPLANPLTLSAVGTIADPSGQDTIPFFYPYDENDQSLQQPYYITVVNSDGQAQFTRENFPYNPSGGGSTNTGNQFRNIIANNIFADAIPIQDLTAATNLIIAPSQHDGFYAQQGNDFRYKKNVTGAADAIEFLPFNAGVTPFFPQQTPARYLNLKCTSVQAGETTKLIQVPLNIGIKTLETMTLTFSVWAQSISGDNTLELSISQFTGSGGISPTVVTSIQTFTLSNAWVQYRVTFAMPSASGITISTTGDDALYLNINFPKSALFETNITKPALYLGSLLPDNDFITNDDAETLPTNPRTGDIRTSLNSFAPWGWVYLNDTTIGNPASGSGTASTSTWNLFYLIWNSVGVTNAPIFDSAGAPSTYGANAYVDWVANKRLSLTKQLGRALSSVGMASTGGVTNWALGQAAGSETHTLTVAELAPHTHEVAVGNGASTDHVNSDGDTNTGSADTTSTGSGTPFSISQPLVAYNIYMKL